MVFGRNVWMVLQAVGWKLTEKNDCEVKTYSAMLNNCSFDLNECANTFCTEKRYVWFFDLKKKLQNVNSF